MTLKEKLEVIKNYDDQDPHETFMAIADDYAIEFLKFREGTYSFGNIAGKWYSHANTLKKYTTEELLKIFKKEKGL